LVPLNRFIRIETRGPNSDDTTSQVRVLFEGIEVSVRTRPGEEAKYATKPYRKFVAEDDGEIVYLRSDAEKGTNVEVSFEGDS
jgi:hypothetical protein